MQAVVVLVQSAKKTLKVHDLKIGCIINRLIVL